MLIILQTRLMLCIEKTKYLNKYTKFQMLTQLSVF